MPKRKHLIIKSKLLWLVVSALLIVLIAPLALYKHAIGLVESMPEKPAILLSQEKVLELWALKETCKPEECASITPYWIYRWLLAAVINDYVASVEVELPYRNISRMASQISIDHMRIGNFNGKGMLWWHLTHACLGIWVQRNWGAMEIATKYSSIHS